MLITLLILILLAIIAPYFAGQILAICAALALGALVILLGSLVITAVFSLIPDFIIDTAMYLVAVCIVAGMFYGLIYAPITAFVKEVRAPQEKTTDPHKEEQARLWADKD